MEKRICLNKFLLFNALNQRELEIIASKVTEKDYADGDLICQKGMSGGVLYLIEQGKVAVTLDLIKYSKKYHVVSNLNEGMFFGELSFFDGKEYSADVYAIGDVDLLELKKVDYDKAMADYPASLYDIQNKIILHLIHTIREMNEKCSLNVFHR